MIYLLAKIMKSLIILTCFACLQGCNDKDKSSQQSRETISEQSDPKLQFEIRKTDLEHIEQINGVVVIDTVILPDERIDIPKGFEFRRIGVFVDKKLDLFRCKGFVSLTGTGGSRLAADGRSESRRNDGKPISESFWLKNEGNESRRVIVYTTNVEQVMDINRP